MINEHRRLYEQLADRGSMMDAEQELLAMGADSIPVLEAIFDGEAKNAFGVPYRQFGLPLNCALEIACRMRAAAKPLEGRIREELKRGAFSAAAMAMRGLAPLEDDSVVALANAVGSENLDVSFAAAISLLETGHAMHPAVQRRLSESASASTVWERAFAWHDRARGGHQVPKARN